MHILWSTSLLLLLVCFCSASFVNVMFCLRLSDGATVAATTITTTVRSYISIYPLLVDPHTHIHMYSYMHSDSLFTAAVCLPGFVFAFSTVWLMFADCMAKANNFFLNI